MYYNYYYIVNNFNHEPYIAKNMINKNNDYYQQQPVYNLSVNQDTPVAPEFQNGYFSVEVLSVTGQPISGALVTVFHFHDNGDLHVHYNLVTDENGKVPLMELPVRFIMPERTDEQIYTNYNLRAFSKDYYPVNIINFRIYPGIETDYTFQLTPLAPIGSGAIPEQTIIAPQNPSSQNSY